VASRVRALVRASAVGVAVGRKVGLRGALGAASETAEEAPTVGGLAVPAAVLVGMVPGTQSVLSMTRCCSTGVASGYSGAADLLWWVFIFSFPHSVKRN